MHQHRPSALSFVVVAVAVALACGGCSSTQGEKMVQSFTKTRQTLAGTQAQVDSTLASLAGLRMARAERLKDAFRAYKDQVEELEDEGRRAKERAAAMKDETDAHIKAWQKEQAEIKDPAIRASLESRREAVRSNFALVRAYADDVRNRFGPFLRRNKEVVQALSIDLSPAAISSLEPSMDQIMADGAALKERISAMQGGLDNIANGVSPIGL